MAITAKVLKPEHVAAGLTLEEPDDHTAILRAKGQGICRWLVTSAGPTIEDIHRAADNYIKNEKG